MFDIGFTKLSFTEQPARLNWVEESGIPGRSAIVNHGGPPLNMFIIQIKFYTYIYV